MSPDEPRPLYELRWIEMGQRIARAKGTIDPTDTLGEAGRYVALPCCCLDPGCHERLRVPLRGVDGRPCYLAPGHHLARDLPVGSHVYVLDLGWTAQAPLTDHLGRPAYGLIHPARPRLEQILTYLAARAGIDEPGLMITADGPDVPVVVDLETRTIHISVSLLAYFPDVQSFDALLGHEIAHILQDAKHEPYIGSIAELEADRIGALLAGRKQSRWAVEVLHAFWRQHGLPVDDSGGTSYPTLSERVRVMNEAVGDLPLDPSAGLGLTINPGCQ